MLRTCSAATQPPFGLPEIAAIVCAANLHARTRGRHNHGRLRKTARAKQNKYRTSCMRFHGQARIDTCGPKRDRAWELTNHEEQSKDPKKKGAAKLVDLDSIDESDSKVIMKCN